MYVTSTPLFTLLLVGGSLLAPSHPVLDTHILALVATAARPFFVDRALAQLNKSNLRRIAVAAVFILCTGLCLLDMAGMEMSLVLGLLSAIWYAPVRGRDRKRGSSPGYRSGRWIPRRSSSEGCRRSISLRVCGRWSRLRARQVLLAPSVVTHW